MKKVFLIQIALCMFLAASASAGDEVPEWSKSIQEIAHDTLKAKRVSFEIHRPADMPPGIAFPPTVPLVEFSIWGKRGRVGNIGVAAFPNQLLAKMYLRNQRHNLAMTYGVVVEKGKVGDESFSHMNKKSPLPDGRFSGYLVVRFGSIVLNVGSSEVSFAETVIAAEKIHKVVERSKAELEKLSDPLVLLDLPTGLRIETREKPLSEEEGKGVAFAVTRITNFIFVLAEVIEEKPTKKVTKQQALSALPKDHPFQFRWQDPFGKELPPIFDFASTEPWYSPASYDMMKRYPWVD